jgi:hypothetical protein
MVSVPTINPATARLTVNFSHELVISRARDVCQRSDQMTHVSLILVGLFPLAACVPVFVREVSVGSITVEQTVYEAVALAGAGMTLLFTAHRALMNSGFTLSRQRLTTDTMAGLSLMAISTAWTTIVFVSGFWLDEGLLKWRLAVPCACGLLPMAFANPIPVLVDIPPGYGAFRGITDLITRWKPSVFQN